MLQSIWKSCSLHGNKPDVFQLGASRSLLNTCFSPTWDSLIYEIRQACKSFIKLGPKYLRFTFFTFTFKEGLNFPRLSELKLLELGGKRRDWYSEALRLVPPSPCLNEEYLSICLWINKPDSHHIFDFRGIIWVGLEIFASFCKSVLSAC